MRSLTWDRQWYRDLFRETFSLVRDMLRNLLGSRTVSFRGLSCSSPVPPTCPFTTTAFSPQYKRNSRGAWVALSVKRLTSAQVMISLTLREFEPRVGLCADSSEPGAPFGFCVSLSLPTPPLPPAVAASAASSPGQPSSAATQKRTRFPGHGSCFCLCASSSPSSPGSFPLPTCLPWKHSPPFFRLLGLRRSTVILRAMRDRGLPTCVLE